MVAVMNASINYGRRSGVFTGFGLAMGATIWAILAVLGVTILFDLFPKAVFLLRVAGAAYLIWLGVKILRSEFSTKTNTSKINLPKTDVSAFLAGLMVSLTNPKAALFFGSVLTAFVPSTASNTFLVGIVALCACLALVCHSITATVFSTSIVIRMFEAAGRRVNAVLGMMFIGMGIAVIYDAVRKG